MTDTFSDVPTFVAVVEVGSFSEAARRLNLSRSAVGKAVARLEDQLGVRLLQRTTRSLSLTEDGHLIFERCERAVAEMRAAKALLDSGRKVVGGRLRVSMPVLYGRLCVAPVLTKLAASHPELEIALSFNDRPVDLVEDGFDLAVRNGPLGAGVGLMRRRIGHERTSVYVSPSFIERHGLPRTPDELCRHPAMTYARHGWAQSWVISQDGGPPLEFRPRTRMQFDDLGAIADAAAAGLGLAWLPSWLVRERLVSGALVRALPANPPTISDTHVVWPEAPYLPTRVRIAIDALAAEIPLLGEDEPPCGDPALSSSLSGAPSIIGDAAATPLRKNGVTNPRAAGA